MSRKVDAVIIGAGSTGLSALRQIKRRTNNFILVNDGDYGTTCARIGCMPSKVLIQAAKDLHRGGYLAKEGILGGENLRPDIPAVLRHVRELRDRFTNGMRKVTDELAGANFIHGKARILSPARVEVNGEEYETNRIIIGVGSRPSVPAVWEPFKDRILTSENVFEQEDLPLRIGVIGLGAIGLELGQAFARLGVEVSGFDMQKTIGGLTDPDVNARAVEAVGREMDLYLGVPVKAEAAEDGVRITSADREVVVDKIVASMGVRPNIDGLGLQNLGVALDERGLPPFNPRTMQIADLPVYIGGDANGCRPILHEALDEGFIAGRNSFRDRVECFCRRTSLRVVFSDPEIAGVGLPYTDAQEEDIAIGTADFGDQARAMVEGRNEGLLRVYVEEETARVIGAEMCVPDGEHLAHILALMIQNEMTVFEALQAPFYHPTTEEGLRTALRDAAQQISAEQKRHELLLCGSCPEKPVC